MNLRVLSLVTQPLSSRDLPPRAGLTANLLPL